MTKNTAVHNLDLTGHRRWYLVANRCEAKLYRDRQGHPFEFVMKMENPQGRLMEGELDSDRPGRGFASARGGILSHGLDKTSVRHETVAKRFAASIAKFLESRANSGEFQELVLVAGPHFLGLLRSEIPEGVKSRIGLEINREFTQVSSQELRESIQAKLHEAELRPAI